MTKYDLCNDDIKALHEEGIDLWGATYEDGHIDSPIELHLGFMMDEGSDMDLLDKLDLIAA